MSDSSDSDSQDFDLQRPYCEICGAEHSQAVLIRCKNYGQDHTIGCHSFCMAGNRWRAAGINEEYFCTECTEYRKWEQEAVQTHQDRRRAAVLQKRGKAAEAPAEMPVLPQIPAPRPHVRPGSHAALQPNEQMRINAASKAAAEAEAAAAGAPAAVQDGAAVPASAAAAGSGKARLNGLRNRQPASAAAHRHAAMRPVGPGSGGGVGSPRAAALAGQHPRTAAGAFVKGLNKGRAVEVNAARKQAAREQQKLQQRRREAVAAGAAQVGVQQQQQGGNVGGGEHEYTVNLPLLTQISCQVVQAGVKETDDDAELHIMLDLKGHLKRSHIIEQQAREQQRAIFKEEMLPELCTPTPGEDPSNPRKHLVGGVFDLDLHPSIMRYNTNPEISYKPLKFVPVQNARICVQEQLKDRQRFIVVSLGQRLLVFLPTEDGELLLLLPRDAENTDDLVQEVVQSVMRDRHLGATPSQLEAQQQEQQQQQQQNQQAMSDSAEGNHMRAPKEEDDDEAEQQQQQQQVDQSARPMDWQQQQQPEYEQQESQWAPRGSGMVTAGVNGLQQQDEQEVEGDEQQQDLDEEQQQDEREQHGEQQQQEEQQIEEGELGDDEDVDLLQQEQEVQLEGAPEQHQEQLQQQQVHDAQQQQQQQQQKGPAQQQQSPSRIPAQAAAAAATPAATVTAAPSAAHVTPGLGATAAAACTPGSVAAAATGVKTASVLDAVQNSSVAQLLRVAAAASPRLLLLRKLIMPQVQDIMELQHVRIYMLGFKPAQLAEGGNLAAMIAAAEAVGVTLHYQNQANTVTALCKALNLPLHSTGSCHGSTIQPPDGFADHTTAGCEHNTAAAAGPAAATAGADSEDVVDLTALEDDGEGFCQTVLLIPQEMTAEGLQHVLGSSLPLWLLLTSPVALFQQTPYAGVLTWVECKLELLQQQREQKRRQRQQQSANGDTGSKQQKSSSKSGDKDPHTQHHTSTATEDEQRTMRLPQLLLQEYQLFRNGVAVVPNFSSLRFSSKSQVGALLRLLGQGQVAQREQQGLSAKVGQWALALPGDMLQKLPPKKVQLLQAGMKSRRVVLLDDMLPQGLLVDEDSQPERALIANATNLVHQYRLVIAVVPDIDTDIQQPQQRPGSEGTVLAGKSPQTAVAAATPGQTTSAATTVTRGYGYTTTSEDTEKRKLYMPPAERTSCQRVLTAGSQDGRILTGTMSQVLQLLEHIVGKHGQHAAHVMTSSE